MKQAWITLLSSEDYLEAVLALNRSIEVTKSKYPLIAAMTKNIYSNQEVCNILIQEHIIIERIDSYTYSDKTIALCKEKKHVQSVLNTASKIGIFKLIDYDKLVYIDADTFMVENADKLFDYPDGAMIKDPKLTDGLIWGFTGLFVFCPKNHYPELYELLLTYGSYYDGDMFGRLWFHIRNNIDYQIPDIYLKSIPENGIFDPEVKIYHLCNAEMKLWKKKNLNMTDITKHYNKLLFYHRMTYPYFSKRFQ